MDRNDPLYLELRLDPASYQEAMKAAISRSKALSCGEQPISGSLPSTFVSAMLTGRKCYWHRQFSLEARSYSVNGGFTIALPEFSFFLSFGAKSVSLWVGKFRFLR